MNAAGTFLEQMRERIIIADAAMGSRLYELGVPAGACCDQFNLTHPALVTQVHGENVAAGARLIETNTFAANRLRLTSFGLEDQVRPICQAGVRLAREASNAAVFVAGAIGPLPMVGVDAVGTEPTEADQAALYREPIDALVDAGVDLILLETFSDVAQTLLALKQVKLACDLPVVVQMTFPDGRHASDGNDAIDALSTLRAAGADVVGTNCGQGVAKILRLIEYVARYVDAPLSAFPNAGLPEQMHGRMIYLATPQYLADAAEQLVNLGVNLIGGCCGTTASDIAAISRRVGDKRPAARRILPRVVESASPAAPAPRPTPPFLAELRQRTTVLVELDPPRDASIQRLVRGAAALCQAGADAITLGDCPLASLRMNSVVAASVVQRDTGATAIAHVGCRDHNLIGVQSLLLGAAAMGLRHMMAITGDPAKLGDHPDATSVYDLNSFKLIELIGKLNRGQTLAGRRLEKPTAFHIGVAFNPNVRHLDNELKRLRRKVELGADYVLTQPVYDAARMREAFEAIRPLGVPVFAGVFPLSSAKHAEFLHNEFPGISIPEAIRKRMSNAGSDEAAAAEGMNIARELIDAFRQCADGLYLVPPFNRYTLAVQMLDYIRSSSPAIPKIA